MWDTAQTQHIQILLGGGALPTNDIGANNEMNYSRVHDVALMWTAIVKHINQTYGKTPALIELTNEPNGHWNTYIDPADWANLACAVRSALDDQGFLHVGISGPGTSMSAGAVYLEALASGHQQHCVAALSVHTWESTTTTCGPREMAALLHAYQANFRTIDPKHEKLWLASEFGSRTNHIADVTFAHTVDGNCYDHLYGNGSIPNDAEVSRANTMHVNICFVACVSTCCCCCSVCDHLFAYVCEHAVCENACGPRGAARYHVVTHGRIKTAFFPIITTSHFVALRGLTYPALVCSTWMR